MNVISILKTIRYEKRCFKYILIYFYISNKIYNIINNNIIKEQKKINMFNIIIK